MFKKKKKIKQKQSCISKSDRKIDYSVPPCPSLVHLPRTELDHPQVTLWWTGRYNPILTCKLGRYNPVLTSKCTLKLVVLDIHVSHNFCLWHVIIQIFGYFIYTDMTGTVVYVLQETCP